MQFELNCLLASVIGMRVMGVDRFGIDAQERSMKLGSSYKL